MKKLWLLIGVLILSVGVIGCSSEENEKPADSDKSAEKKENEGSKDDSNQENTEDDDSTEAGGTETGSKPPVKSSKEKLKDQENLKLGDTAVIQSTLGTAEITIETFKEVKDVKGVGPQRVHFLTSDIEIKNVGDNTFKAADWMELLEMVWDIEVTGAPDDSDLYEVQAVSGELKTGDSAKGVIIFDVEDNDEYSIMVNRGLLAGGGVYNNAVWTLKKSDLK